MGVKETMREVYDGTAPPDRENCVTILIVTIVLS